MPTINPKPLCECKCEECCFEFKHCGNTKCGREQPTSPNQQQCCEKCYILAYRQEKIRGGCKDALCPCHKPECICELMDTPTYHARDNAHSTEKKWHCSIHGSQERYWLLHKERQDYCKPCNDREREIEDEYSKGYDEGRAFAVKEVSREWPVSAEALIERGATQMAKKVVEKVLKMPYQKNDFISSHELICWLQDITKTP